MGPMSKPRAGAASDPRRRAMEPASSPARPASRFASADQLAKAIRDPRYRSDPAYRAWVAETLSRSDVFGRGGPSDAL